MNKKKHFPVWLLVVATLLIIVSGCIFCLNKLDEAQAKVIVYTAFSEAYDEFVNSEEADITKAFEIYEEDKYCHKGSFVLNETALLDNQLVNLIRDIPVEYAIICEPDSRTVAADISLSGYNNVADSTLNTQAYVNDEEIIFKLEEFYDEYLMIPNSDIRENYEESILYSFLGDILSMLPDNFSLDLYPDITIKEPVISEFLKQYETDGTLNELFDDISIRRTDIQRDFQVGDNYVAAKAYNITVSKSLSDKFLDIVAEYAGVDKDRLIEPEKLKFVAYISDDSRLCGISMVTPVTVNDKEYEAELLASFRDKDKLFSKILLELSVLTPENKTYSFNAVINNKGSEDAQESTIIISMYEPYASRLFEMEISKSKATDAIELDMAFNLPELSGRISYACLPHEEDIIMPENVLGIYELNLWQILNIYSSANWSFIK